MRNRQTSKRSSDGNDERQRLPRISRRSVLRTTLIGAGTPGLVSAVSAQEDTSFVNILSADASDYPSVQLNVSVDTELGRSGELTQDAFTVSEEGTTIPIQSFNFSESASDIVFVFDDTSSMEDEIDGIQAGVTDLVNSIEEAGIDAQYGLVTFKDDVEVDQTLSSDADELISNVNNLVAEEGGDLPEDNFDAIDTALGFDYRPDAQQFIIDITDDVSHYPGDGSGVSETSLEQVANDLTESGTSYIAVAPPTQDPQSSKRTLADDVGGLWINIQDADFSEILQEIIEVLVSVYRITYSTNLPVDETGDVGVTVTDPNEGTASDNNEVVAPADTGSPLPSGLVTQKENLAQQVNDLSVVSNIEETFNIDLEGDPEIVQETINNLESAVLSGDISQDVAEAAIDRLIVGEVATSRLLARIGPGEVGSDLRIPDATTNLAEANARYIFNIGVKLSILAGIAAAIAAIGPTSLLGFTGASIGSTTIVVSSGSALAIKSLIKSGVSNLLDAFITGDETEVREELDRGAEELIQQIRNGEIPSASDLLDAINDLVDDLVDLFRDVIRYPVEFGIGANVSPAIETLPIVGTSIYQSIRDLNESFQPENISGELPGETPVESIQETVTDLSFEVESIETTTEDVIDQFNEIDAIDAALEIGVEIIRILSMDDESDSLGDLADSFVELVGALLVDFFEIGLGIGANIAGIGFGYLALDNIARGHEAIYTGIAEGTEVNYEFI